jgi:hypothetical protein
VKQRFYDHEDFMLGLQAHQAAVRKVAAAMSPIRPLENQLSFSFVLLRPSESPLPETARPPPMKTTFAAAGGFILGMVRVTE